jgi:cytochrome P450
MLGVNGDVFTRCWRLSVMFDFFSDELRRNPYPVYDQLRAASPVLQVPPPFDAWMIFDYEGVKRALSDHDTFSSRVPGPQNWFLFCTPT